MTILNPRAEATLRQVFKRFNPLMLLLWRLGLGAWINAWPEVGGRIMIIAHTGRKTGARRYAPVNYALVDGELYCTAGFGAISDWCRNLLAHPEVEVWLPDGWWAGVVEDVSDSEKRLPLLRQVLMSSGVVTYLVGIDPIHMTDGEFGAITSKYRLLHFRRTEARTGPCGPGELAWVWPLAALILLFTVLRPRRR